MEGSGFANRSTRLVVGVIRFSSMLRSENTCKRYANRSRRRFGVVRREELPHDLKRVAGR
jgi:hypothetical protein